MTPFLIILGAIIFISVFVVIPLTNQATIKAAKQAEQNRKEAEATKHKLIIDKLKTDLTIKMYAFGRKNFKIRKAHYDIEEGGDYLTEYNKYDCDQIDYIINDELSVQSRYFYEVPYSNASYHHTVYEVTTQRIEKRILELKTYAKKDDGHFGF